MANHKSAVKRAKQSENRRIRNKSVKTRVKNVTKAIRAAATSENGKEESAKLLDNVKSVIDKAAKKGVLHKNTAARKISRLTKLANTA